MKTKQQISWGKIVNHLYTDHGYCFSCTRLHREICICGICRECKCPLAEAQSGSGQTKEPAQTSAKAPMDAPVEPLSAEWEKRVLEICDGDPIAVTWIVMTKNLLQSQRNQIREKIEGMRKMGGEFGFCEHCKFHKGDYEHDFGECAKHDKILDEILSQL